MHSNSSRTESDIANNPWAEEHTRLGDAVESLDSNVTTTDSNENSDPDEFRVQKPPPNQYAVESEETFQENIFESQALLADKIFLRDESKLWKKTLEEHLDALAYNRMYPDQSPPDLALENVFDVGPIVKYKVGPIVRKHMRWSAA